MGFHMPVWDDLRAPATGINPAGSATPPTVDTNHPGLLFDQTSTNIVSVAFQMPHTWIEGSIIRPHIHWTPVNTNTGNVYWRLEYQVLNPGQAIGAYTTVNILDAGDGVADAHQLVDFGDVTMTGKLISCMVLCRLSRIGGDGTDTYNANARLLEFDIHYQVDGMGSIQEYVKNGP